MARSKWRGDEIIKNIQKARYRGVTEAAEFVLGNSNKRVPHDEGHLQNSGITHVVDKGRDAAVSYNTPYAVRQHEETHYNHPNGRQSKYLENTIKQDGKKARKHIENAIKQTFKRW